VAELPSLPAQPRRFTFVYQVVFTNTNGFTAGRHSSRRRRRPDVGHGVIDLITPRSLHGDGRSWLSTDVRVFSYSRAKRWLVCRP
jgi:hypothetical protein